MPTHVTFCIYIFDPRVEVSVFFVFLLYCWSVNVCACGLYSLSSAVWGEGGVLASLCVCVCVCVCVCAHCRKRTNQPPTFDPHYNTDTSTYSVHVGAVFCVKE
jgi:hypothetical protein